MSNQNKRVKYLNSTVCYLKNDNKVLMIKFTKEWGQAKNKDIRLKLKPYHLTRCINY